MTIPEIYHPVRSALAAVLIAGVFGVLFVVCIVGDIIKTLWDTLVLGKTAEDQIKDHADGERL